MAHGGSEACETWPGGVSEAMELLHIDVEADAVEERPARAAALFSVSLFTRPSFINTPWSHYSLQWCDKQSPNTSIIHIAMVCSSKHIYLTAASVIFK